MCYNITTLYGMDFVCSGRQCGPLVRAYVCRLCVLVVVCVLAGRLCIMEDCVCFYRPVCSGSCVCLAGRLCIQEDCVLW